MSVLLFQIVAGATLCIAAWRDVATRTIPDTASVVLVVAGLLHRAPEGWWAVGASVLVALLLFVLLLLPALKGALGGGDVKLASAMAFGLAPASTWDFIFATVMIGGALGVAYILGSRLVPQPRLVGDAPLLRRVLAIEAWRLRRRGPLPYGVAIAGGGLIVLLSLPGA